VSDLISEVVLAFEYRGSSEDIGITVHSHPTLSETVKEAALATLGRAIHI
jgi:dihydrolipoamide dehydrogenase